MWRGLWQVLGTLLTALLRALVIRSTPEDVRVLGGAAIQKTVEDEAYSQLGFDAEPAHTANCSEQTTEIMRKE